MFKQIVSNLSFSPSAASQLTYYLRRLQKERITRKLSVVFAVGLMVLQIANIVSPAAASNTPSSNDIVYGGLVRSNPKADMLRVYDQNRDSAGHTGYQALFKYFGISRGDIERSRVGSINSSDRSLKSLGRNHRFADDQLVSVGGQNYYLRPLINWGAGINYSSLVGTRSDGSFFAIMIDCGNIVVKTIPVKQQPPKLQFSKTIMPNGVAAGSLVKPGTTLGFRMNFRNTGSGTAHEVVIQDPIPANTTLKWQGGGMPQYDDGRGTVSNLGNNVYHVWWRQRQLASGASGYVDFQVKVNENTPNNTKICNTAYIRSQEIPVFKSDQICYTVFKEAPPAPPPPPVPTYPKLVLDKKVKNITQKVNDAKGSTAKAGDTLEYTLTTKNIGDGAQKAYQVTEDVADIQAYADIIMPAGAALSGGKLAWNKTDIAPGTTLTKTFQVKVKDPLPTTAISKGDPKLNDCELDNVYGTVAVGVKLACPVPKEIETTITKLPQTGGAGTVLTFGFVAGIIFLYMRNRQLIRELKMLRVDNGVGQ